MKWINVFIISILANVSCFAHNHYFKCNVCDGECANEVNLIIDERLELVSIVFRLAGAEEYVSSLLPEYMEEVDTYFKPYIDHELISFIRETRQNYKFGYSIVAASAFMIEISGKSVKMLSTWDIDEEFIDEVNQYWTRDIFDSYIHLLDKFYRDSRFHEFFDSHKDYYETAINRNTDIVSRINMQWFKDFFGESLRGIEINMGLCLGNNNYFIWNRCNDRDWDGKIAIVVGASSDVDGIPVFHEYQFPVVIHEIMHYFTRPLISVYYNQMEESMEYVYSKITDQMTDRGYGNARSMAGEWFNNLFTNLYFKYEYEVGRYPFNYMYNVAQNEDEGYIWMGRAVAFMNNFYLERNRYPTIKEFMPQLVAYSNLLRDKWDIIVDEYEMSKPYIIDIFPAGDILPLGTNEIRIRFSHNMNVGTQGLMRIEGYSFLPFNFEKCRWEDENVFVISLNQLEKGKTYAVLLPRGAFFSEDCHCADNHIIILKTE